MAFSTVSRKKKPASPRTSRKAPGPEPEKAQRKSTRLSPFYNAGPTVQPKLRVSRADDAHEKEAEAVADRIMADEPVNTVSQTTEEDAAQPIRRREEDEEMAQALRRQEEEEAAQPLRRMEEEEEAAQPLRRMEEEEETSQPVRREEEEEAAQSLRRQEEEEAQTLRRQEEEEAAQPLSRRAEENGAPQLSPESDQTIQTMRGSGEPLPEDVRLDMEKRLGADFSDVGIHRDSAAAELCQEIQARAFTVGRDIFFASGEYAPESRRGRKLLAHELAHVAQNRSRIGRVVRRDSSDTTTSDDSATPASENCRRTGHSDITYTVQNRDINFNKIKLPPFKAPLTPAGSIVRPAGFRRTDETQNDHWNQIWRDTVGDRSVPQASAAVDQLIEREYGGGERPEILSFRARNGFRRGSDSSPVYRNFLGTPEQVARELCFPTWNTEGDWTSFEVDHRFEIQLGGQNRGANLWLLNATTNRRSGQAIWNFLRNKMAKAVSDNEKAKPASDRLDGTGSSDQVLRNYNIFVQQPEAISSYNPSGEELPTRYYWTQDEIVSGAHTRVSNFAQLVEIDALDRDYGQGRVKVFPQMSGGVGKLFHTNNNSPRSSERDWIAPWRITSKEFFSQDDNPANLGVFNLQLTRNRATEPMDEEPVTIRRFPGARNTGYLDLNSDFLRLFGQVQIAGLSPVRIDSVGAGSNGMIARGKVEPSIPILSGLDLDLEVSGSEISVFRRFSSGDIEVPSPFSVDNVSLEVGVNSERGLFLAGDVDFGIENIGEGKVSGDVTSDGSFGLDGTFRFDERLFGEGTEAEVRVGYRSGEWSVGGSLSIAEGRVPGVRSATIEVNYSEGRGFAASGSAELDVPGVESGALSVSQSEEEGWVIGGSFNLSADTPGIRGGRIEARVREKPDGSGYAVSATGEAQPDIPGINSNLTVSYNDGAFTAEVEADYSRGMLSGRINAGVTNRGVGEDGQLSETAEEGNPLIVYGGGRLTIQIAPWLQGTAGVQFAPNGEITVTGEIGLPDEIEIFPRREFDKSIFSIAVQAPIVPGIVAEVGGGLRAVAGIGPGKIDQLRLGIEYNPAREEDTTVTGDAHLEVPADAGLRLSVRAGIGLGITGASATGGLEIGGTLGIEGAAEAGVHVEWTPRSGLDLRAHVGIHAQPSFTFDIGGYVSVRALGFEVYDNTWEFASYSFGSDYRFGIRLPVHYREGQPFNISLDDIEFEVPDIDTNALLRGLIDRIA